MSKSNISAEEVIAELLKSCSCKLFMADNGERCITLVEKNKTKTFFLKFPQWDDWLLSFIRSKGWKLSENLRKEVTDELVAMASDSGEKIKVYVRVAKIGDEIVIDLNNSDYECVHISKDGFRVQQGSTVPFLRPEKQMPLPKPIEVNRDYFLIEFKKWFSSAGEGWLLQLAFILKCLHRDCGSYVILLLEGPPGAGKTTRSNRMKKIIDPAEPSTYSPPSNNDDIIVASTHSFLLVFDNISGISGQMADVFCRLSTGGGLSKRKHYHDNAEMFYVLHRPCIINGIDEPTNRADFMNRCLTIELDPIRDENRIAESILSRDFEASVPHLLGGIYGLLADCLKVLDSDIQITGLPRMTDFARMGIAVETVLGLPNGTFLSEFSKNQELQSENSFWTDELCTAIYTRLERADAIEDTPTKMRNLLVRDIKLGGARISARGFSNWLKRIEPLLNSKGIVVSRDRSADVRKIKIMWENGCPNRSEYKNLFLTKFAAKDSDL